MAVVLTENIWSFHDDVLACRPGQLTVGLDEVYVNESDVTGVIQVEAGLRRSDTIVFLGFIGLLEEPKEPYKIGYLVTHVDTHSGSGVMLAGDRIEQDPRSWMNPRIKGMWNALHALDYSLEDFDLPKLDKYLRRTRAT